jgi:putative transposase
MKPFKIDKEHDYFFCTDTIVGWQYVFTSSEFFECIISSFKYCQEMKGLHVHAYVIMPNHVHSILSAANHNLSDSLRDYRRFTSRSISRLFEQGKNKHLLSYFAKAAYIDSEGNCCKVWREGSHPEAIESSAFYEQKLNYIHENPVRKGYVLRPEDWLFSSARNYYLNDHPIIKIDILD